MFSGGLPSPLIFLNRDLRGECFYAEKIWKLLSGTFTIHLKIIIRGSGKNIQKNIRISPGFTVRNNWKQNLFS